MRSFAIAGLLASVALSGGAIGQSEREIRKDERAIQSHQAELDNARHRGNRGDIQEAREDLREARKELREDRRDQSTSRYEAPYRNWSQSTPAKGSHLRSKFYGARYVISNPMAYRLRPTTRNHKWIRYGDDVLLVNVRNGRISEVLPRRYREM